MKLSLDDLDSDLEVLLPSFNKTISVRPYRPSQRITIQAELSQFVTDGATIDAEQMAAEKAKAYIALAERIATECCYIDGEHAFDSVDDQKLGRLAMPDLEAIINAAMSGSTSTEALEDRQKKSQAANSA